MQVLSHSATIVHQHAQNYDSAIYEEDDYIRYRPDLYECDTLEQSQRTVFASNRVAAVASAFEPLPTRIG